MINIADNNLRENLSGFEVASQMKTLRDNHGYSAEQIAAMFHCGVDRVYDSLSVFKMDEELRCAFEAGKLTLVKAVVIGRFPVSERSEVLRVTLEEGRSTSWLRGELSRRQANQPRVVSRTREVLSPHGIDEVVEPKYHASLKSGASSETSTPGGICGSAASGDKLPLFSGSIVFDRLLEWYPMALG